MTPDIIHLVSSPSAAGTLKYAIASGMLEGQVFCSMDSPEMGPLDDGVSRLAFWQNLGYREQLPETDIVPDRDIFDCWKILRDSLAGATEKKLLLWLGETGSDYVFLRMACFFLQGLPNTLYQIKLRPFNGEYAAPAMPADVLISQFNQQQLITEVHRGKLIEEYQQLVKDPATIRFLKKDGTLAFLQEDAFDHLLLSACTDQWLLAARVVGEAMGHADPRNPLGDAFLASRLEWLIVNGKILADGLRLNLRSFRVKCAGDVPV